MLLRGGKGPGVAPYRLGAGRGITFCWKPARPQFPLIRRVSLALQLHRKKFQLPRLEAWPRTWTRESPKEPAIRTQRGKDRNVALRGVGG